MRAACSTSESVTFNRFAPENASEIQIALHHDLQPLTPAQSKRYYEIENEIQFHFPFSLMWRDHSHNSFGFPLLSLELRVLPAKVQLKKLISSLTPTRWRSPETSKLD